MYIRRAWGFSFVGLTFTLCTVHIWANIYSFVFFMFAAGVWMIKEPVKGAQGADEDESVSEEPVGRTLSRFTRFEQKPRL